ncbi:hypothetical protein BRADI_3g43732v3 [Brachypodium distachyon]|uniref:Uncharacterized protein n=1 Tax=Brachypodium distachyon TaxID=15368 RepID=A0A0Q3FMX3_BRADI|nr:hypothetical protein BRADI_3g43732v3 [Brachypodium distachyon]
MCFLLHQSLFYTFVRYFQFQFQFWFQSSRLHIKEGNTQENMVAGGSHQDCTMKEMHRCWR